MKPSPESQGAMMRSKANLFLTITLILAMSVLMPAQARFKTPVGTRAMGMGNAFIAVADDVSALFWNPAGLDQIDHIKLQAINDDLSLDRRFNDLSLVFPDVLGGAVGVGFQRMEINGIKEYTTTNGIDNLIGYFDDSETVFKLGYGNQITKWVALGLNLKYMDQSIKNFSATGFAIDAGMLFTLAERLSLGFGIRDLGGSMHWTGTSRNPVESVPVTYGAGLAYKPRDFITFALDLEKERDMKARTRFGVEFWFKNYVGLRAGTDNGDLNLGLSFLMDNWQVDYAFQTTEDMGDVNRVSATVDLERVRDVVTSTFKTERAARVEERIEDRDRRRADRMITQDTSRKAEIMESEKLVVGNDNRAVIEALSDSDSGAYSGTESWNSSGPDSYVEQGEQEVIDLTQQAAESYFAKGNSALSQGDYYNATLMFNKAIQINPYFADAYRNLGVIYQRQKMYDEAIRAYEQSVYIKPDSEYVYISLGDIYERRGLVDKAIEQYEKVMEIAPSSRTAAIAEKMISHLRGKK
jgi:tetratricopeptide (TPR) repeat protein